MSRPGIPSRKAGEDVKTVPPGAGAGGSAGGQARVEVRRSTRRRRTVSAYRDGDKTIVLLPARFSPDEEKQWVERMLKRLAAREKKLRPSDDGLLERASELSAQYLDGGKVLRVESSPFGVNRAEVLTYPE